ncbi:HlyD family secretion protein [Chloroflexota bacterium]
MKKRGIMGMLLLGLLIGATACGDGGDQEPPPETEKSDINVTVTGDGNIEASSHERLTFGSGGKIDKIYVKEGDKVIKGDVLAKLDTDALELAEAERQAALANAKLVQNEAELAVVKAQAGIIQAEAGVTQAEATLKNAEVALELARTTYSVSDIRVAEAAIDISQRNFDEALFTFSKYDPGTPGYDKYQEVVLQAEAGLKAAKDTLDAMLTGFELKEVAAKRLHVEAAEQSVELAGQNLEIAEQSLNLAKESVEYTQQMVNLAQQSLDQIRKDLEEATIIAPFDGMVANIGMKEGEFLSPAAYTGTTIVELIDLRHMELTARVYELDVVKVKTGQKVMISVDAIPGMKLEGLVTFISPVAREPGFVLFEDDDEEKEYEVKIDFDIPGNSPIRAGMSATAEIIIE